MGKIVPVNISIYSSDLHKASYLFIVIIVCRHDAVKQEAPLLMRLWAAAMGEICRKLAETMRTLEKTRASLLKGQIHKLQGLGTI